MSIMLANKKSVEDFISTLKEFGCQVGSITEEDADHIFVEINGKRMRFEYSTMKESWICCQSK